MESAKKKFKLIETRTDTDSLEQNDTAPTDSNHQGVPSREKTDQIAIASRQTQLEKPDNARKISKNHLINKLNYINFQDSAVLINFNHRKYDKTITLKAKPQPCMGDLVDCLWLEGENYAHIIQTYEFKNILIANGQRLLKVEPEVIRIDDEGISVLLPDSCQEISSRKAQRYPCKGISVQFIQNSTVFSGALMDFNGLSFRVKLTAAPPQTFDWVNPAHPVNVIVSNDAVTIYSGECKITRHTRGQTTRNYILEPLKQEIQRFKQKEFRSERYVLTPTPNMVSRHPLTAMRVDLKVVDLSGSGFSVEEDEFNTMLLPGIILHELELSFAESYKIKCSAQVVFRKEMVDPNGDKWIKCGLALLDMDIRDHLKLISMLHQAKNKNSYICNDVDLDALWDFFFETGFIYPDKYATIQKNKELIKETYAKIYTRNPQLARHFIYQEKGTIYGHMAMIRFYENAWMIHHHAARKSALNKAGLIVLDQIGRMGNDSHRLHSLHLDYMICYYRPDNKFPSRVFGGAARNINDPKACSLDGFAYSHYNNPLSSTIEMPKGWQITETQHEDLEELAGFYGHVSGGLMLEALDLRPEQIDGLELSQEYEKLGLTRLRHLYSLRHNGRLKALFLVNQSDVGLNLSDITNCIKVFVTDPQEFTAEIYHSAIAKIAKITGKKDFPTLIYPAAFADESDIAYEKIYNLWIVSLQHTDAYFRYLKRLVRFI
jgi:hypothetical protein